MAKFIVEFDIDSDAFKPYDVPEIARILRRTADFVDYYVSTADIAPRNHVRDINGNTIGTWSVTADQHPEEPGHVCDEGCNPGNCEVQHDKEFGIPEDEDEARCPYPDGIWF